MFPDDRKRLLQIIAEAKGTTVLLSGDRHRGELSVLNQSDPKPLFDLTSSSFNHCYPYKEESGLRVGELIFEPHFGWLNIDWAKGTLQMKLLSSETGEALLSNTVEIKP